MTIHRIRQGKEPSGGPADGHKIVQLGEVFVEYSGTVPDQAELDAHLNPPPPPIDDRVKPVMDATPVSRAEYEDFKAYVREILP